MRGPGHQAQQVPVLYQQYQAANRAQKNWRPWHPGWKTIPNLGDNLVQKQREKQADRHCQTDKPTDRQTETS